MRVVKVIIVPVWINPSDSSTICVKMRNKLEDKIKLAEQKLKEASTKEVYWMVKTEYHV